MAKRSVLLARLAGIGLVVLFLLGFAVLLRQLLNRGSGIIVVEKRALPSFRRIALVGQGNLIYTQGGAARVRVEAEDNVMPFLEMHVTQDTLHLRFRSAWLTGIQPTQPIIYYVTGPALEAITIRGSGTVVSPRVRTPALRLAIHGDGRMTLGVETGVLESQLTGIGVFRLHGYAEQQHVDLSGNGRYFTPALRTRSTRVAIRGQGVAQVNVARRLHVRIRGFGEVAYRGAPLVSRHIEGRGRIYRLAGN